MLMFRNFEDPQYKKWRKDVYKRDNFHCQWPGCVNNKKSLNHLLYIDVFNQGFVVVALIFQDVPLKVFSNKIF